MTIDPSLRTDSYARIRNPRVLLVVRVSLLLVFMLMTSYGALAIFPTLHDWRDQILSQPDMMQELTSLGISADAVGLYQATLQYLELLVFTVVGLYIFYYRSDDWVALLLSSAFVGNGLVVSVGTDTIDFPLKGLLMVLIPIVGYGPIYPALCLFPDGRFVPRWSVWLVPIYAVCIALGSYLLYQFWVVKNFDPSLGSLYLISLLLFWSMGAGFLLLRLRRTESLPQRHQIKQLFGGLLVLISVNLAGSIIQLVPKIGHSGILNIALIPLIQNLGTGFFAVAVAAAILRYRLWDIDLVLNRGIVYAVLLIPLVLVFVGVILTVQAVLQAVLGSQAATPAALISAGTVALLFNPTRLRLQSLVDRWLFGLRFDLNQIKGSRRARLSTNEADLKDTQLAVYEVKELIGRGGMSEVYLGFQSTLKRQVAIKVLLPHLAASPEFQTRFERESRIAANLHHHNIINIIDFGDTAGTYYMVMEYIDGPDLSSFLHGQILALPQALPLVTQIAEALDYAHSQGVVHRDVKPSNIMLKQQSEKGLHPILMDFGLTKLADSHSALTQSGPLGTLAYMAPEQIAAAREADHRADIYALGVMCYQILTGKLPFSSNNQAALLFAHLHKPPPDPRLGQPDFPGHAAAALMRALDKEPGNRQQSAGAFAAELFAAT